jgi:hypothetical protein
MFCSLLELGADVHPAAEPTLFGHDHARSHAYRLLRAFDFWRR